MVEVATGQIVKKVYGDTTTQSITSLGRPLLDQFVLGFDSNQPVQEVVWPAPLLFYSFILSSGGLVKIKVKLTTAVFDAGQKIFNRTMEGVEEPAPLELSKPLGASSTFRSKESCSRSYRSA